MRQFRYALIILVLGTVAACTSDADPQPSDAPTVAPSTTVSTSATPTPTATPSPSVATTGPNVRPGEKPPVLPALAKTNSRPGAAAFAYYWFQSLDWGYATTDSTLAKMQYLPQCGDCARFMKTFDEAKSGGESFRGGRITTSSRKVISNDNSHPSATVIDVFLNQDRLITVGRDGKSLGVDPSVKSLRYRIWVSWTATQWKVLDYKQVVA